MRRRRSRACVRRRKVVEHRASLVDVLETIGCKPGHRRFVHAPSQATDTSKVRAEESARKGKHAIKKGRGQGPALTTPAVPATQTRGNGQRRIVRQEHSHQPTTRGFVARGKYAMRYDPETGITEEVMPATGAGKIGEKDAWRKRLVQQNQTPRALNDQRATHRTEFDSALPTRKGSHRYEGEDGRGKRWIKERLEAIKS